MTQQTERPPHTPARPTGGVVVTLLEATRIYRQFFWRSIFYGALVQLATTIAITPLATWLFYRILSLSGSPVLTNYELLGAAFRPSALIVYAMWFLVLVGIATLNIGGLALLASAARNNGYLSIRETLMATLSAARAVRGLAILKGLLFFLIVIPALGAFIGALDY